MEIRLVNDYDNSMPRGIERPVYSPGDNDLPSGPRVDIWLLVRKYWLLTAILLLLGAIGGVVSVVFSSPMYDARLTLEVKSVNESWIKNSLDGGSLEANDVNIQTQVNILRGGTFLRRGADRVRSEIMPLAPMGRGIFSRLRERFRPATRDPIENARIGLDLAMATFDARPVTRTRLIELSCDSTSPDVAAHFLNAMAAEFVADTSQAHAQSSQKTSDWLSGQIEDTKSKLQDAQQRLRGFVQASGNLFAGQEAATLADVELNHAKTALAEIQSQRIATQTRYEQSLRVAPESLPEVQGDPTLHADQEKISSLKQERAGLLVTLTPKNEKVQLVDAKITQLEQAYQQQLAIVLKKIRDDYDAARREEQHRAEYYAAKSQHAGAEAGKASQYNELKREVETLQQMYQTLLAQSNQVGLSNSVPINPMRIVEPSTPPAAPYKPKPMLNLTFGMVFGLAISVGLIFLRERMDPSVRAPGSARSFLNTPELGVIPNLYLEGAPRPALEGGGSNLTRVTDDSTTALTTWRNSPPFVTESFRGTLASILRAQPHGRGHTVLLITSPGPAEGKTTVVQNLGIALAETGRKVLLLDGDFRRPHLHKRFRLSNDHSLIDLLSEGTSLPSYDPKQLCQSTGIPGLFVIPNRPTDNHVAKALYSPRLRAIFQQFREAFDMVIVDAPPFLHLADARIMAPLTDAAVLVLRSGSTSREHAIEAHRRMREDGLLLLGTVLTAWDASTAYMKRNYYYYDYADDDRKQ
jgi:succinoglycan biosynthesis transport protein ExoP